MRRNSTSKTVLNSVLNSRRQCEYLYDENGNFVNFKLSEWKYEDRYNRKIYTNMTIKHPFAHGGKCSLCSRDKFHQKKKEKKDILRDVKYFEY
jgi:hypothetical protein